MKAKTLITSLFVVSFMLLNGCATTRTSYEDEVVYRPSYVNNTIKYQSANYDVGYGPDANEVDYNHDSMVGYGGVNVYDYDQS